MPTKKLPPVDIYQRKFTELEKVIRELLKKELYLPLLVTLDQPEQKLKNAKQTALERALQTGSVKYSEGIFFGKFNAAISKELRGMGAKYVPKQKGYALAASKVPQSYGSLIASSQIAYKKTVESINKTLAGLSPQEIAEKIEIKGLLDEMIFDLDAKIDASVRGVTITPELSEFELNNLKEKYQEDMVRDVKNFTEKEIETMRAEVQDMVFEGKRPVNFAKYIEKRYGVGVKKSKFLARQETRLMLSEYKKQKYKSIGVRKYVWQTVAGSAKSPVRSMHKLLDQTEHDWDNPPITDKKGNRNNPGEDYNCRCTARPIIEF